MRKILRLHAVLFLSLLLVSSAVWSQERTISGTVLSDDNKTPIPGVTVRVKGSTRVTQTDSKGNFTIRINAGETLQISHVGYTLEEVNPGSGNSVSVNLRSNQATMEEVVVTAMDIRRNPRELGYSVQKVNGDEIKESQRENFLNSLQGRVAGLTINQTGGAAGASSQIVLRGFNSISLDNSPLFVIDGIIADNQTLSENHGGGGAGTALGLASARENRSNDYSNRIADLNPNDIESVTVLKGPEATALYGSQASSGAIVITTKKANTNGKVNINYDNSFRVSKLSRLPKIDNKFGPGTNGIVGATLNTTSGTYFGAVYPDNIPLYDNLDNFFRTGFAQTHNLAAEYGKNNYTIRGSASYLQQESPIPTNSYDKFNARISGTVKIGKYVDIAPSISYIRSINDKPLRGLYGYLLTLLVWPAHDDVRKYENTDGLKKPVYAANPNAELDNPFFNVNNNRSYDQTDRAIGTMAININPTKWITVSGRFGYDTYRSEGSLTNHPQSFYLTRTQGGSLDNYYRNYYGYNHTITATAKKKIGDFSGRIMIGNMWQDYETQMYAVYGTNLVDSVGVNGRMYKGGTVGNGTIITQSEYEAMLGKTPDSSLTRFSTRTRLLNAIRNGKYNQSINRQSAYFGEASLSWKNAIFLTYTHRFEESSIFPKEYRKYNYPAGSISIMLSDLIPGIQQNKTIDYLKLRGSLASTARSSAPYANQSVFAQNTGSGGGFYYGFTNANPFLRPERQSTFEIGTEWRMFKSRLSIDISYYNTKNKDLIVELFRASYGTGFVLNTLNVGTNKNTGVEVAIDATPVRTGEFQWSTRVNFNKMQNKVLSLPANVPEFYISDTWLYGNARGGLITGGPTTSITGLYYLRNNAGEILIDPATGVPINAPNSAPFRVLGDRNPDFTIGWLNNLTYKNWRFSFLWDLKVGGDIFNGTDMYLTLQGRSKRTSDRYTPRVVQGVLRDGKENTATPTLNTISIIPAFAQTYYTTMPEEAFIEKDVNWFRLRDISLSYTFPTAKLRKLKFLKSFGVFVTANDLVLFTNYSGADPSVNGNTAGTRGVGAFGFDYGNIGAPISVNAGIRANF
jgi:TonB-linked SusC/RagA family outer membrane protein